MIMAEKKVCVLALPIFNQVIKPRKRIRNHKLNKEVEHVASEAEDMGLRPKKRVRATAIDDDQCFGDPDPVVIQEDNFNGLRSEKFSSRSDKPGDLCGSGNNKGNSGGVTTEESSSTQSNTESGISTSNVKHGDQSPEQANVTGSRKITLRVRKRSEPSEECLMSNFTRSSAQVVFSNNEVHDGVCNTDYERVLPSRSAGKTLSPEVKLLVAEANKKVMSAGDGKKRFDGLHKLLFLPNGLPDGTNLAYTVRGRKILEGYKTENGIFCNHCSTVVSPSQFEAHAGMASRKKPYHHIYTSDGVMLHHIAVTLAEGNRNQPAPASNNDIRLTSVHNSVDSSCRLKPTVAKLSRRAYKKSSNIDYGWACVLCTAGDFSVNKFDDRTVIICDQCEREYHVGCLREDGRCDLKEIPKDKWFCCCDCQRISTSLRDLVVEGSEAIASSETSKINEKLKEQGLLEVGDNDVQLRLLNGKCCLPEHQHLLSKAVCLFKEGFGSITVATGRDLIPVMVHGKKLAGQEFGGMYCLILTVKSIVVSIGLLRILGREVAELPLVVTRTTYQGKGYFHALFSYVEKLLGSLKVEKLMLPATETAKPMWVNRFGFREVSQEKVCAYMRTFQLTGFSDTVLLEKQLQQHDC